MAEVRTVTAKEFFDAFGLSISDVTKLHELKFRILNEGERDHAILRVIATVFSETLSRSGRERLAVWESGWSECLRDFYESKFDPEKLTPRYMHPFGAMRFRGQYIRSDIPYFERRLGAIFREQLFWKYLSDKSSIFEFGCGTGTVLMELAKLFPGRPLIGLDWAETSQRIMWALRDKLSMANLIGVHFDMFNPDYRVHMEGGNCALLTVASLEQLGDDWGWFLNFIMDRKPAIVINIEPFVELYDENNLIDYLASKYHAKRNYLTGYLPAVEALAATGKAEILAKARAYFGNMYHEGYSYLIWRPL